MRRIYVFPVLVLLMIGCGTGDQAPSETPDDPAASHRFDPSSAAIGDSVLGFRIESLDVQRSLVDSVGWVGTVLFEGDRILEGTYRRHPFDPELAELCFFPDEISAIRLPIFPNDERTSWLCFSNQEEAQEMLGPLSDVGTAAIEIDRFRYHYAHSDVYNTARLVRVVSYADSLRGEDWVLISMLGEPVIPDSRTTFSVSPQYIGGYAGCNWYGADNRMSGDTLRAKDMYLTARLCERPEGVMDQEIDFVMMLAEDLLYRIVEDTLRIENLSGETVLTFQRRRPLPMNPADLKDSRWSLHEFNGSPPIAGSRITLIFNEDRFSGFAGCRNYTGHYYARGDNMSVPQLGMNELHCADEQLLEQEGNYTTALTETGYYLIAPQRLELYTVSGDTLLFRPQD